MSSAALMIVTYNRLELTKQMLNSLFETTDYQFHLIITDNGSVDGTVDFLNDLLKQTINNKFLIDINIIFNKKNNGIAIGRNQCLLEANKIKDALWYSTLDNDVLLPQGWLTESIDILSTNKNYGATGVNFEPIEYELVILNGKSFRHKERGNLGTACTVFPKSMHKLVGFFNHKDYSNIYGLDDSDYFIRFRAAGFKLCYIKEPGIHIGEIDENLDYRKMKTYEHDRFVDQFKQNCYLYFNRKKSIYIPFTEEDVPK